MPVRTFLDLPQDLSDPDRAAAVVIPVPYDGASSWVRGAAAAPQAILDASAHLELFDIETGVEAARFGIATRAPIEFRGAPTELADHVAGSVGQVLDRDQLPVVLGGDHSVAIGAIHAAADRVPGVSVLQLDAHADTRESYGGSSHNHACVMARARQWCPIVQVGLRSMDRSEVARLDRSRTFFAHEVVLDTSLAWIHRVVDRLDEAVYVTIDLDVFDPGILPATGTPEPGGLNWYQVMGLLERVTAERRVVGFDVTELCPAPGEHASTFLAAKLVYRLITLILVNRPTPSA